MEENTNKRDETLKVPFVDSGLAIATNSSGTHIGARSIFYRFMFVAVAINLLFGLALVIYDIGDTNANQAEQLHDIAKVVTGICRRFQEDEPSATIRTVITHCSKITNTPLALANGKDEFEIVTSPQIRTLTPKVYPDHRLIFGQRIMIRKDFSDLSGSWSIHSFGLNKLLVIIPRRPEDLGSFEYLTIGAGVLTLGLLLSVGMLLMSARWMLYRPVQRLVNRLTGALARDVERRKAAENRAIAARSQMEELLTFRNNLLHATPKVGIVATDLNGIIRIFNRAAEKILGYKEDEVSGKVTLEELRKQTRKKPAKGKEIKVRSLIHLAEGEEFRINKAGEEILLSINTGSILDSGGHATGQLVTFIDISDQKRLEAELQLNEMQLIQSAKMASLGEMATGVAHELNQPLNNIGLLTSRIKRKIGKCDDMTVKEFSIEKLDRISGQVERAGRIIEQMRSFGRKGENKQLTIIKLIEPISHVVEMLHEQLKKRSIELELDVDENIQAFCDPGQLEQVLLNLLVNARDAFEDGKKGDWKIPDQPQISIRAERINEKWVNLIFSDNGPGIPKKIQEKVFQPFFTTKEVGRGTGLGLAISYSLITGFGGRLQLDSEKGKGTVFTISLKTEDHEE